jgi:hypothetical protein
MGPNRCHPVKARAVRAPGSAGYGLDRMSPARLGLAMQVVEFSNDISRTPIGLR